MRGEFIIAVHALLYLKHKGTIVTSSELADNICSPPARIRKVMLCLKKAKFVETSPGVKGGYFLQKNPDEITLADCLNILQDKAVVVNWFSGDKEKECLISSGMSGLITNLQDELNNICNEFLSKQTIGDMERIIFSNKK